MFDVTLRREIKSSKVVVDRLWEEKVVLGID